QDFRAARAQLRLRPLHDPRLARDPAAEDGTGQRDGQALAALAGLLGLGGLTGLADPLADQDRDDRAEHAELDFDVRDVHRPAAPGPVDAVADAAPAEAGGA